MTTDRSLPRSIPAPSPEATPSPKRKRPPSPEAPLTLETLREEIVILAASVTETRKSVSEIKAIFRADGAVKKYLPNLGHVESHVDTLERRAATCLRMIKTLHKGAK